MRIALANAVAATVVLFAAAACGDSSHAVHAVNASDMKQLVLRQQDLGTPFASFYAGPQTHLDNQGTPRDDPTRNGREGGWVVRYHRPGSKDTAGPIVVESRVDVFKGESGAKHDVAAYRAMFGQSTGTGRRMLRPNVGDQAVGVTFVQPGSLPLRFYRIAWRYRNATASVTAEGFNRKLVLSNALELVRKQQNLLSHA